MTVALASQGASAVGTTSLSVPYPSGIASGDLLVLYIAAKYSATTPTIAGWTLIDRGSASASNPSGVDTGDPFVLAYSKVASGSESGSLSVTTTGVNAAVAYIERWTKTKGNWYVACSGRADTIGGGSTSVSISTAGANSPSGLSKFATQPGAKVVVAAAFATDNFSYSSISASKTGTTFSAATKHFDAGTTQGDDVGLLVYEVDVLTGTDNTLDFATTATASGSLSALVSIAAIHLRIDDYDVPSFVNKAEAAGTTSLSIASPSGIATGDLLILHVGSKYPTNLPTTPSGWTQIVQSSSSGGSNGVDTGNSDCTTYYRVVTGSESWPLVVTITGADSSYGAVCAYRLPAGGYAWGTPTGYTGSVAGNGATSSVTMNLATAPPRFAGDFYAVAVARSTDLNAAATTVTIPTTFFGATSERIDQGTSNGGDSGLWAGDAVVSGFEDAGSSVLTLTIAGTSTWTATMRHAATAVRIPILRQYTLSAAQASFTLTGQTVGLALQRKLTAAQAIYALAGQSVGLTAQRKIAVTQASYAIAGQNANLRLMRFVVATAASYALTGQAVAFARALKLSVAAASFALTGQSIGLTVQRKLAVAAASYALTGQAAFLAVARVLAVANASIALTGQNVTLNRTRKIIAAAASFALTGQTATLAAQRKIAVTPAIYALTAQAVAIVAARVLAVANASIALTGQNVTLNRTRKIIAAAASFALTGQTATLAAQREIAVTPAIYALTAQAVAIVAARVLAVANASIALTGQDVSLDFVAEIKLSVSAAILVLAGGDVGLRANRLLAADAASIALSGQSVNHQAERQLTAVGASVAVTPSSAALEASFRLAASAASVALVGQSAALRVSRELAIVRTLVALTAQAVSLGASRRLAVSPASYVVAGQQATLLLGHILSVSPALIEVTGGVASFRITINESRGTFRVRGVKATSIGLRAFKATAITLSGAKAASINVRGISMNLIVGDDHDVTIEVVSNKTGLLADPTTLTVFVKPEKGAGRSYVLGVDTELERIETGRYRLTIDITVDGHWDVVVISAGPTCKGVQDWAFSARAPNA